MAFAPSPELTTYAEKVIPRYPESRSAIMMLLHFIQREQGHLPLEAQEWVAERLNLTPIQVREVVTFYPFYREQSIGRRHIRVCRTLACALRGAYRVREQFCTEFETDPDAVSPDGRVTVEFAECLASCGTAPVALVDDDLHENLTIEDVKALCQQIKTETPVEEPAQT